MTRPKLSTAEAKPRFVPKLRFPEFRNGPDWELKPLSREVDLISGMHLSPDQYGPKGGVPYFTGPSDFINEPGDVPKWTTQSASLAKRDDTLITVKGSGVGELWYLELPSVALGRQLMAVRTDNGSSRYIFQLLLTRRTRFEDLAAGNLIPGLSRLDILGLEAPFPSHAEQQKIAECLSTMDELMAAESQKLDALKAHKKGLMQQLFPREGETLPRLRFPEFRDAPEWELKTLKIACEMRAGQFVRAAEIKERAIDGFFPCYGGNGLRGYTSSHTHEGTYPLIGRQGALCGNVKLCTGKFHATEHAVVASPSKGLDVGWLYYALDLLNLNRFATGQAQPGLSVEVLEKVPLAIPEKESEQHRIASCLSSLEDLIAAQSDQLEALKTHKKGLMQQLFPSPAEAGV